MPAISVLGRKRQEDHHRLKASLAYIANCRTARVT